MRDNVEMIESLWDAFSRGDLDKVAAGVAETGEVVFPDNLPWGGVHTGPDGCRAALDQIRSRYGDFKVKTEMVLGADDDHVVVVARVQGRGKGGKVDGRVAWIYRMRDGKVMRAEAFPDTAAMLEALG
jgi:ketosteroid isomerase-like protein